MSDTTVDISAISGLAPLQSAPGDAGRAREVLGQEFGRLLFQTLLKSATVHTGSGTPRKAMQALPLEMFADQFTRQLAQQHEQMFGRLLFGSMAGGRQR